MKKIPNGYEIIQLFEQFSPKNLAMEGDRIGLELGTLNKPINKVMVALDVLDEVVDEAIEQGIDLIIAHHPIMYRPLKNIVTDQPSGKLIEKLIKNDITVYAAHTNLDITDGGVNDMLVMALGLQDSNMLIPTFEETLKKLIVFVPKEAEDNVREALGNAGAGYIGNYSHCSFSSEGHGRFLPGDGTNPYIGTKGKLEVVDEVKIETVYPKNLEKKVLSAMLKAHPYEEVAFDLYPIENKGKAFGLGRIGNLPIEMSLQQFTEHVKQSLHIDGLRVVGNLNAPIKKVAVVGGDGNKYWSQAKFNGADVYVTGDIYYHVAHDAMASDLNIVDAGHNIEKVMKFGVVKKMKELVDEKGFETEFIASEINTDPFKFM
ncbi:Nif3-like dinuclear metal center hexameric protein [Peribacillus alkalitolerans]|uniref:Nif3-like dinuclear metal center hexameric protein n=1 Tax=Peribacillus alkalitolerans TaxID=1550385 RepID=UPI0013D08922|nr:Nif3-like dinuclear metal center hexameric protein [Peribacillus alkalitolerans]